MKEKEEDLLFEPLSGRAHRNNPSVCPTGDNPLPDKLPTRCVFRPAQLLEQVRPDEG